MLYEVQVLAPPPGALDGRVPEEILNALMPIRADTLNAKTLEVAPLTLAGHTALWGYLRRRAAPLDVAVVMVTDGSRIYTLLCQFERSLAAVPLASRPPHARYDQFIYSFTIAPRDLG